jgi:hypothetical protein
MAEVLQLTIYIYIFFIYLSCIERRLAPLDDNIFLVYLYIYLLVRDLAQQRLNAHAQTPRAYRDW